MPVYVFTQKSFREFKKLSKDLQERIILKLDFFVSQKNPLEFAHPLINHELGQYRFRVGDYRIIFDIEGDNLVIHSVGHRRDIYR